MEAVLHILIMVGLAIAAIGIVSWLVYEFIDFLKWIFPRNSKRK